MQQDDSKFICSRQCGKLMRRTVIWFPILVSLSSGTSVLLSQEPSPQPGDPKITDTARFGDASSIARAYQDFLYGVVKEVSKDELVLSKTKFGIDQSFKLVPKTKFIHDGKRTSLDELKAGDQVWVNVKNKKKTGEMIAVEVVWGVMGKNVKGKGIE
jgi:hypothetical protein